MGTPEFAVPALEVLAKNHTVVGVYTQPDRPVGRGLELRASAVKTRALALGLHVFQPERLTLAGEFEKLAELKPDVIVVAAYGQILKQNVLDLPRYGCLNIHSSLLPRWRGASPIQQAILAGDTETGVTTMHLVQKLDAGDILLQARTPIQESDTAGSVHDRLAQLGAPLILETLDGLSQGRIHGQPQDEALVTYAAKLTKEMESLLPKTHTAVELHRQVRALNPWPGTSIRIAGERLRIKTATPHRTIKGTPGTLFERSGMLLVGTTEGSLELQLVQWDGKKAVTAGEFFNGLKGKNQTLPLDID